MLIFGPFWQFSPILGTFRGWAQNEFFFKNPGMSYQARYDPKTVQIRKFQDIPGQDQNSRTFQDFPGHFLNSRTFQDIPGLWSPWLSIPKRDTQAEIESLVYFLKFIRLLQTCLANKYINLKHINKHSPAAGLFNS